MKKFLIIHTLLLICCFENIFSLSVSSQDAKKIAEKIWKNECAGTMEGLTHWNKGENFPSLGIGHFIWYPLGVKERFHETFPDLLIFLQKQEGVTLPDWLKDLPRAPWSSREEFILALQSPEMKSLRQFLFDTRHLQALFIANRLEKALPIMLANASKEAQERITATFKRLAGSANGLYALIDYVNFKGEGTSSSERYNGEGWGLLQVLEQIPSNSEKPHLEFVKSAKTVLERRVKNAPPERHEEKWLKGWFNRLDTYLWP